MARLPIALAFLAAGGCALIAMPARVRSRHASEFRCETGDVETEQIGSQTYRATGCGKQAIYVCVENACMRDSEPVDHP